MAQSGHFAALLADRLGRAVELVQVSTLGDQNSGRLDQIGGAGVFVAAVRQAVLEGDADLCVHSLKDLPTLPEPRLSLAAIPQRASAFDALVAGVAESMDDLPNGASVGTGSPRRAAQLKSHRPDLRVQAIRGNVDTRLSYVESGRLDAVILAAAGLERLGLADRISAFLPAEVMLPAPGQGALAVEVASVNSDADLVSATCSLDHRDTRVAVTAERVALATLEAGCTAPVGALSQLDSAGGTLMLTSGVFDLAGGEGIRRTVSGSVEDAQGLGERVAAELISAGAGDYLGERVS